MRPLMNRQKWDSGLVARTIRQLFEQGEDVSYGKMVKSHQPLVLAARSYFGSYKKAVETAGIDYAAIRLRPKWTAVKVIQLVRDAAENGTALNHRAVFDRGDDLGKAAIAASRDRLFGSWSDALFAAGLNPADIARQKKWSANTVLHVLSARRTLGQPLNGAAVQKEVPSLYMAAMRFFGNYDAALTAAAMNPDEIRRIKRWTRARVVRGLREFQSRHGWISYRSLHRGDESLLSATRRFFGTFTAAAEQLRLNTKRPADDRQGWLFERASTDAAVGHTDAKPRAAIPRAAGRHVPTFDPAVASPMLFSA